MQLLRLVFADDKHVLVAESKPFTTTQGSKTGANTIRTIFTHTFKKGKLNYFHLWSFPQLFSF